MKKIKTNRNIDVISKYFYPVAAGIETNIYEVYGNLVKKEWKVTVHTSKNTLTQNNILPSTEIINGLKVKRYKWNKFGFLPHISWRGDGYVVLHNFNVFPHSYILIFVYLLKTLHLKKIKLILVPHGGFVPEWSTFPPITRAIKKIYHYSIGTFLINHTVDKIRSVSEWERKEMTSIGINPRLVKTIINGLEEYAFIKPEKHVSQDIKRKTKKYGKYMIQIGRIHPIKNQKAVIEVLKNIQDDVNYVIIGPIADRKYYSSLKRLIINRKLSHRVYFAGVVRGHDKYYLIKNSILMIHPSLWESYGNTLNEGKSQGKIIITGNTNGMPETIRNRHNGFCVNVLNIDELSLKVNYVLNNTKSTLIKQIEHNNIVESKMNSWLFVSKAYEKLLTSNY